jgi:hypothetical protein
MMMMESRGLQARVAVSVETEDRRVTERVPGPFDAWRVGVLETPVRIFNISVGGCFVHAMHEQEPGVVVLLKIQLPEAGWLELKAETLYRRAGFGFGVKFIDTPPETQARLARALEYLKG